MDSQYLQKNACLPVRTCYTYSSCSRDILLVYSPIWTSKTGKNRRFGAVGTSRSLKNRMETVNLLILEPFFICISGCRPMKYRGSSYAIHSIKFSSQPRVTPRTEPIAYRRPRRSTARTWLDKTTGPTGDAAYKRTGMPRACMRALACCTVNSP
jgi:hypothetical protein